MEKCINFIKKLLCKSNEDKQLLHAIYAMTGVKPSNILLYKIALQHSSIEEGPTSNERLEFLGDAVLSLIIGEYLFKKYPLKGEGFLTNIRSRIVNRTSVEELAKKIRLHKLLCYNANAMHANYGTIYGNALEALIGAIYIDKGYQQCKEFVIDYLINVHIDLKDRIENDKNFKSQLLILAQKHRKNIRFQIINEKKINYITEFTAQVLIDKKIVGTGLGGTKKDAEQAAAQEALQTFNWPL